VKQLERTAAEVDMNVAAKAGPARPRSIAGTKAVVSNALNGASRHAGPTSESPNQTALGSAPAYSSYACLEIENDQEIDWPAQDWKQLIPRLYLVAIWRLRRHKGAVLRVREAEDLVNEAIAKTIEGARTWTPKNCTLFQHLAGVIASDIWHAVNSSESRLRVSQQGCLDGGVLWPPDIADETPNQEHVEEWRSEQRRLLDYLNRVDPKIGKMAELTLLHDVKETVDLCRFLDLAPSEVANLRKRMKRAARVYHTENWS
jgi:DNA-directed RNA polymerase specialized sigma24 family protein